MSETVRVLVIDHPGMPITLNVIEGERTIVRPMSPQSAIVLAADLARAGARRCREDLDQMAKVARESGA